MHFDQNVKVRLPILYYQYIISTVPPGFAYRSIRTGTPLLPIPLLEHLERSALTGQLLAFKGFVRKPSVHSLLST